MKKKERIEVVLFGYDPLRVVQSIPITNMKDAKIVFDIFASGYPENKEGIKYMTLEQLEEVEGRLQWVVKHKHEWK